MLSFVAAATRKLRMHAGILVLPYRNPGLQEFFGIFDLVERQGYVDLHVSRCFCLFLEKTKERERYQAPRRAWLRGFGFYYETYVREADGEWRFTYRKLERTHAETSPGASLISADFSGENLIIAAE